MKFPGKTGVVEIAPVLLCIIHSFQPFIRSVSPGTSMTKWEKAFSKWYTSDESIIPEGIRKAPEHRLS